MLALMQWPVSTRIQAELTTERIEFEVGTSSSHDQAILVPLTARALGIEKFKAITFEPEPGSLQVADPSQYDMDKDDFPPPAWKTLPTTGPQITIKAKDTMRHPRVTIEGPNRDGLPVIRLDAIAVSRGSRVTLETRGARATGLTIKVGGQQDFSLPIREPIKLTVQHGDLDGIEKSPFPDREELTYRFRLPEQASWIDVASQPHGFAMSLTFSSHQSGSPILKGIAATTLDFTRQARAGEKVDTPAGDRVSALIDNGRITFPDFPHLGTIVISKDEAIGLEQLSRFTIKELSLRANTAGMHIVGEGMVQKIRTKVGQIPIQYDLTAFDTLKQNPLLTGLLGMAWLLLTLRGAYQFRRQLHEPAGSR